ncbi:MAG: FtsQ-type POTRA domain-containing protein [Desulfuromonadales bacterium]|nr:FtsQ-type POTRA domain-containing protein [Desulfuromonadales bacterium]
MHDLKFPKAGKVKTNRRKKERAPLDWKKLFRIGVRLGVIVAGFGLAVSGGVLISRLLFASEHFRIEAVQVENNQRVTTEQVLGLSDIQAGTNIFDLDLQGIGNKIEEEPWIATARVERILPRQVRIRITERQPLAVINLGYLYYLDASGEVFKMLDSEDRLDFPVVTGIDRKFLLEKPAEARQQLIEAMGLLQELSGRRQFTLAEISELHIDQDEGFLLITLEGGVPVRLGFSHFAGKLDRLERIYPEIKTKLATLKYIDLNVADRVIVRLDRKLITGKG